MYKAAFSRHLGQLAIALSLLGLTGLAHSAPDTQFKSAFQQFMQANSGDNSAIHRAAEAFAALYKNAPSNPVAAAAQGRPCPLLRSRRAIALRGVHHHAQITVRPARTRPVDGPGPPAARR